MSTARSPTRRCFCRRTSSARPCIMDACRKYGNVALSSGLDRRGLRRLAARPAGSAASPSRRRCTPAQPLQQLQGRGRSAGGGVSGARTACRSRSRRCSNNYGPYQFPEKLIPLMIVNALDGPAAAGVRPGAERARLAVCRATTAGPSTLMVNHGRIGEVYNIGGHNEMRNIDIVQPDLPASSASPSASSPTSPTGRGTTCAMPSTPRRSTRSSAGCRRRSFADGIGRTIDWYLANRSWWEEILSGAYRTGYERLCGGSPTP